MHTTLRRILCILGVVVLGATLLSAGPVSAAAADTTPPVLRSVSVPPGPYVPGQELTWSFDIVDESPILFIDVLYATPSAAPGHFLAQLTLPAGWRSGSHSWTIPASATEAPHNGSYEMLEVWMMDAAGKSARYYADGRLKTDPVGQTTHTVDIRSPLAITNSPRDLTPPVLEAFTAPTSVSSAQTIGFEYAVKEPTRFRISVSGRLDGGEEEEIAQGEPAPNQGSVTYQPPAVGIIELTQVVLIDANSNTTTYLPDGTVTTSPPSSTTPTTHPFTIGRIKVLPTPAQIVTLDPVSGGARLSWTQTHSAGHRITINPGNRVITGGRSWNGEQTRNVRLSGLQNGVTHTITVTPTSTAGDGPSSTRSVTPRMTMKVFSPGDKSGDRRADVWATGFGDATSDETWRLYTGAGGGAFGKMLHPASPYGVESGFPGSTTGRGPGAAWGALQLQGSELQAPSRPYGSVTIGRGFNMFRVIDASSDLTGDGVADLIGITPAGDFYRYTSTSTGAIGAGVRLGGGWGAFHAVFSPGDFNGDGRSDVVGVDSLGKLWLYPGNGRGAFFARVQIGNGWAGFGSVLPLRDFSGDGKVDIGAITMDGKLVMYPGNGRGGFLAARTIGNGWGAFL